MTPLDGPFASALAARRDRYNALVAGACRAHADFDVAVLERQLRGPLRAAVEACEAALPGCGAAVVEALFGPVVELVAAHRIGGGTHDALMQALPAIAGPVAAEPRLVFGSLANAVVQLRAFAVPVDEWLRRLAGAADADAGTMLAAGQVAAWALGLAHYRDSALETAGRLPAPALAAALGADADLAALARLREDRWWRPGVDRVAETPRVAHRVGGFRGFGGPFLRPPAVVAGAGDAVVFVESGGDHFLLHADAFGATLTRAGPDDGGAAVEPVGRPLPAGLRPTSVAHTADLTALTIEDSYQVLVVEPAR